MKTIHLIRHSGPHILSCALFLALALDGSFTRAAEQQKLAPILQPFVDNHLIAGAVVLVADASKVLDTEAAMTSRQTAEGIPQGYGFGWTVGGGMIAHTGAWKTNMAIHPKAGLITIFLVQNSGWRNDEEGRKIEPAFRKAAVEMFAQTSE